MKTISAVALFTIAACLGTGIDLAADQPAEPTGVQALSPADLAADNEVQNRILKVPPGRPQAELCADLAWNPAEPDPVLRAAALRWLRASDPRVVVTTLTPRIGHAPPATNKAMLELMGEVFPGIGGVDFGLNVLLADQIRAKDPDVARTAIHLASRFQLREAYIPLREILSRPRSPLQAEAIEALGLLGDERAVDLFVKLLETAEGPRDKVYEGLTRLGRRSSFFLKLKLTDKDPAERQRALDALLPMVTAEDLSALYGYIEKYPPEGALKTRVYGAIATAETSIAAPPKDDE